MVRFCMAYENTLKTVLVAKNSLGSSDVALTLSSGHISYHGQRMAI